MGKVSTREVTKRKKKKDHPPNNSLSITTPRKTTNYGSSVTTKGRSIRPNPNYANFSQPEFSDDEEDERKEKKVKLVVGLPRSEENNNSSNNQKQQEKKKKSKNNNNNNKQHSRAHDSAPQPGSDSVPEPQDPVASAKKPTTDVSDCESDVAADIKGKKPVTVTDTQDGTPLKSGPTPFLPDKEVLIFIVDKLQKKDTYGAFSEPVDLKELPDYFEVIDQAMDFGTIWEKLDSGAYKSLQELEADVYLICSNAMQYNAPGTVYYRQARSIQDLARREFENLRHQGLNSEPHSKAVRKGRPPNNKNQKKPLETPSSLNQGAGPELPSAAAEDKANGSSSYNLRKAPPSNRFRSSDMFVPSQKSRNGSNYSERSANWNDEFPEHILRADMRSGKKQIQVDETRRDTYKQFHPKSTVNNSPASANSIGDMNLLAPVGLNEPLAYATSVAKFAANLGPTAWDVASRKIESVLPPGTPYGPGWVSESGPYSQPLPFSTGTQKSPILISPGDCSSNQLVTTPSASNFNTGYAPAPEGLAEALWKFNSPVEAAYMKTPFPPVQQNQPVYQSQINNGFGGMFGYRTSTQGAPLVSQVGGSSLKNDHFSAMTSHLARDKGKAPQSWNISPPVYQNQVVAPTPSYNHLPSMMNHFVRDEANVRGNWNISPHGYPITGQGYSRGEGETSGFKKPSWPPQHASTSNVFMGPPDLNVRIPTGSPSSSLQIGSPQHPDLALQL